MFKAIGEVSAKTDVKELMRLDSIRRRCVAEITSRLNAERRRDNEMKVEKYIWTNQISRSEALKVLRKHPDRRERIWPAYSERGIHFLTIRFKEYQIQELLDQCNKAEKDRGSFGKTFSINIKVQK